MDDFVETVPSPREEANPQTTNTELNLGQIKSMLDLSLIHI